MSNLDKCSKKYLEQVSTEQLKKVITDFKSYREGIFLLNCVSLNKYVAIIDEKQKEEIGYHFSTNDLATSVGIAALSTVVDRALTKFELVS